MDEETDEVLTICQLLVQRNKLLRQSGLYGQDTELAALLDELADTLAAHKED